MFPKAGERGRGRGNAIRPGWCGPQAQPRTRPGLIELPEGEGSTLSLTARGVWLVQIPLAHKTEAAGPSAPPPCCGHSILKTEFTVLGLNCHSRYRRQWPQPAQRRHSHKARRRECCGRERTQQISRERTSAQTQRYKTCTLDYPKLGTSKILQSQIDSSVSVLTKGDWA
mgnify:CR=1 FL=1